MPEVGNHKNVAWRMSPVGTERTCRPRVWMSARRGEADSKARIATSELTRIGLLTDTLGTTCRLENVELHSAQTGRSLINRVDTVLREIAMALRRFVIERDIPKVGTFEREQLRAAAAKSNEALHQLGPDIQWVESYVADNKTFCIYLAEDEAIIRKHAEISGFPATKITEVKKMIDPTTERSD